MMQQYGVDDSRLGITLLLDAALANLDLARKQEIAEHERKMEDFDKLERQLLGLKP